MSKVNVKNVIKSELCIGCGLCCVVDDSVKMEENQGLLQPTTIPKSIANYCPSLGYDLKGLGCRLFLDSQYLFELGWFKQLLALRSSNTLTLSNASSGGIMTEIAKYALDTHMVDGVICTKYECGTDKVRPLTFIAESYDELLMAQGSKYCPTSTLMMLKEVQRNPQKKYLLIGTPCQIAGFRLYSENNENIKKQIPLCMSNFCGGYRDFRELDYFIHNVAGYKRAVFFRHRGGGQPGGMRIVSESGEVFSYPYPEYAKLSHFVKVERCSLCMDAVGELADISCGDAWLESLKADGPWSIAIVRSTLAKTIVDNMVRKGLLNLKRELLPEEVIKSQKNNLTSKKYRQYYRIILRSLLLKPSPNWYNNYPVKQGSIFSEAKIFFSKERAKHKSQ